MIQSEQLAQGLDAMRLDLPVGCQEKLLAYLALLYKWNKTYSLTALREQDKAVSHHLLDSLSILPFVSGGNLLDVGSGGGMPGIPLAIVCPELVVTLLDSNSKKTAFLQQTANDGVRGTLNDFYNTAFRTAFAIGAHDTGAYLVAVQYCAHFVGRYVDVALVVIPDHEAVAFTVALDYTFNFF